MSLPGPRVPLPRRPEPKGESELSESKPIKRHLRPAIKKRRITVRLGGGKLHHPGNDIGDRNREKSISE